MKLGRVAIGAVVLAVEISVGALEYCLAVALDQYVPGEVVLSTYGRRNVSNLSAVCEWVVPANISKAASMRRNMAQRMITACLLKKSLT